MQHKARQCYVGNMYLISGGYKNKRGLIGRIHSFLVLVSSGDPKNTRLKHWHDISKINGGIEISLLCFKIYVCASSIQFMQCLI